MAAFLNSAIMNLDILDSAILVFPLEVTHTCQHWFPPYAQKHFTHSFWLNFMMAAIFNSAILNSIILDSTILVFPLKLTHTCWHWFPPFAQKNITHSLWINLMMAAILNSAILDSDTLLSSLRFTRKLFHFNLTLTQTNSIWLTWWG